MTDGPITMRTLLTGVAEVLKAKCNIKEGEIPIAYLVVAGSIELLDKGYSLDDDVSDHSKWEGLQAGRIVDDELIANGMLMVNATRRSC